MAEILTLSAPIDPSLTVFRVSLIAFDWQNATIKIHLRDWNGGFGTRLVVVQYSGPQATTMMIALNKANLSTTSLHQRVIAQLLADGKLPSGTPSGTPD